jgi:LysM repeat protein/ABC-type branched-subunit amino acid transport system substrate-binding protein
MNPKKKFQVSSTLLLLLAMLLLSSCRSAAQVQAPVEVIGGVEYYIHPVKKGETAFGLARTYQCDVNDIIAANPGSDGGLREGTSLRIPVAKCALKPATSGNPSGSFLTHEVQRKETLYSIAKIYSIDLNEVLSANPGAENGIKKGQVLRIPIKSKALSNYQLHTVNPGETLYSIAKSYGLTAEELKNVNPGLVESLRSGQVINIPAGAIWQPATDSSAAQKTTTTIVGNKLKEKYAVAVMLPFFSDFPDSASLKEKDLLLRDVALNMYRGMLMAADSLSATGFNADLYVYDVLEGTTMVKNVLEKPEMNTVDLVIGPTYRDALAEVSKWSVRSGVHVVCPVQQPNAILLSSPNMSKVWPSTVSQWEYVAGYVARKYKGSKVILANSGNIEDKKRIDAFHRKFIALTGDSATEYLATAGSLYGINNVLSSSGNNIVIAPSTDPAMASSLFKGIKPSNNTILFATSEWENYDFLEADDRARLHLHYPEVVGIDYQRPETENWVQAFRKRFKTEPSEYAFLAYDIMLFYCSGLQKFGPAFPQWFDSVDQSHAVSAGFDFLKTGMESGYENRRVAIMGTFEDQVVIVNK